MILLIILGLLALIICFVLATVGWGIGTYNRLQTLKQDIRTQLGNVGAEYQRRADLFYNLVQAVKSVAKFEKDTLTQVIAMRGQAAGLSNVKNVKEAATKMKGMDNFFSRLMVTFERYPTLKATEEYHEFMEEVRVTEDRVNIARTDFNEIVREFNVTVKTFPSSIIANMKGFSEEKFFQNEPGTEKAPKVDLSLDK